MTSSLRPGPVWRFHGRPYRSITGLYNALFADSGATSISGVSPDRRITATTGRGEERKIVATYSVSPPQLGAEVTVTRVTGS